MLGACHDPRSPIRSRFDHQWPGHGEPARRAPSRRGQRKAGSSLRPTSTMASPAQNLVTSGPRSMPCYAPLPVARLTWSQHGLSIGSAIPTGPGRVPRGAARFRSRSLPTPARPRYAHASRPSAVRNARGFRRIRARPDLGSGARRHATRCCPWHEIRATDRPACDPGCDPCCDRRRAGHRDRHPCHSSRLQGQS